MRKGQFIEELAFAGGMSFKGPWGEVSSANMEAASCTVCGGRHGFGDKNHTE